MRKALMKMHLQQIFVMISFTQYLIETSIS